MLVVKHLSCNQVLEIAAFLASPLQMLEVGVEVQGTVRVAAEVIGAEKVEQDLERIWEPCV